MSDSVMSAPVCDSLVRFAGWIWTAKAPTSQHLALRNMTNIEHRSVFQLLHNLRPRDAEGLGKRRPNASRLHAPFHLRSCHSSENRVLSPNNSAREHGGIRLRDQLHLAARQKERHLLDLCLLGVCLLVTSVSLVASCKKWICPPDNHARTFDMSGDILACLGHTDWHYFEPWQYLQWYLWYTHACYNQR